MSAPYVGLGETDPNHPLEVEGQVFISNVEQGTTTNSVPFEVYSDYDGASTSQLRGARQMRLRVTPSNAPASNVNIDMGIEPQTGSYLYIGNPVTNTALSSNSAFRVQASGDIYMGNDLRVVGTITTSNIEGASPITINAGADPVKIIGAGGVSVTGGVSALSITGSGAALTTLNASNIANGTLNNGRLPASISVTNLTGTLTGNGAGITSINATNISTGTLNNGLLPTNISVSNVTATKTLSGATLKGNGAGITSIANGNLPTTISRTLIQGATISATGDVYGSRFIDRNSTSYLCNPFGASLFRELELRDAYGLTFSAGTSYWIVQHLGNTTDLRFEYKGSNRMFLYGTTGNLSIDGTYSTFSDERLKDNILDVDDAYALNVIKNLKPKTYNWKDQTKGKDLQYGFIAQDIEKLYPEMVSKIEGVIPTDQTTYPSQITSNTTMEVTMTDVSTWSSGDKIVIKNSENDSKTLTIHEIQGNVLSLSAEKISSNFVNENNETYIKGKSVKDVLTINTNGLDPLMISAIQQLERRVTELENKLAS